MHKFAKTLNSDLTMSSLNLNNENCEDKSIFDRDEI